jgi:hypothetical protein
VNNDSSRPTPTPDYQPRLLADVFLVLDVSPARCRQLYTADLYDGLSRIVASERNALDKPFSEKSSRRGHNVHEPLLLIFVVSLESCKFRKISDGVGHLSNAVVIKSTEESIFAFPIAEFLSSIDFFAA